MACLLAVVAYPVENLEMQLAEERERGGDQQTAQANYETLLAEHVAKHVAEVEALKQKASECEVHTRSNQVKSNCYEQAHYAYAPHGHVPLNLHSVIKSTEITDKFDTSVHTYTCRVCHVG